MFDENSGVSVNCSKIYSFSVCDDNGDVVCMPGVVQAEGGSPRKKLEPAPSQDI